MGLKNPSIYAKILAFSVLGLLVLGGMSLLATQNANAKAEKNLGIKQRAVHAPIHIASNSEFTQENGVVGGSGTQSDPYIIEGWEIDANGGSYCIWIENTTAYFVIRNCYVFNATGTNTYTYPYGSGIALTCVQNGIVTNNNASGNYKGIYMDSSNNDTITNNNVNDNSLGIHLSSTSNTTIINNNANGNTNGNGIYLNSSSHNTITNNNASDNSYGIYIDFSSYTEVANNTVSANLNFGIYLDSSTHSNITNNSLWSNGIVLSGCSIEHWNTHNIDTANLVNGKPVYYYKDQNEGRVPSDAGQVILSNCTHMGIDGLRISGANIPIQLGFSSYNTVSNNTLSEKNSYGIYLYSSSNNTITNNDASGNYDGIYLFSSNNNCISNNNACANTFDGIYLDSSSNNTITNNTANNNIAGTGIYLESSSNNNITNNTASGNYYYGIWLDYSSNNTIANNIACDNDWGGIWLASSSNNNITNNTANHNSYGIWLCSSNNNIVINNNASSNYDNIVIPHYGTGIFLAYSNNNTIANNIACNNDWGDINLEGSSDNTITNNNASGNSYGIYLESSNYNNITYNTMWGCGIVILGYSIEHWNTHTIDTTNLVNGKPVYYYKDQNGGSVPADAGQVILANCSNMVIEGLDISNASIGIQLGFSSNNRISNNIVNGNSYYGIYLVYSSNNNITNNSANENFYGIHLDSSTNNYITNNNASGNHHGIFLLSSSSNHITNNNVSGNYDYGISLGSSNYNAITNNNVSGSSYYGIFLACSNNNNITNNNADGNSCGIYLGGSSNNTITNNNASSNSNYGIFLGSDLFGYQSNYNTITNNNASGNGYGIYLDSSSYNNITSNNANGNGYGISLGSSNYNAITNNNVSGSSYYGIFLAYSNNNTITYNWFCSNTNYGANITSSSTGNIIHHNNFIANNGAGKGPIGGISQAYDDSGGNYWYENVAKEGNYWSNWDGTGWGTSSAYPIDGSVGASDWYPLSAPAVPPKVRITLEKTEIEGKKDSILKATITVERDGVALPNMSVTVSFDKSGLSATTSTTDQNGTAIVTITLTQDFTNDTTVKVTPKVADTNYPDSAIALTIKAVTSENINVNLELSSTEVAGIAGAEITATLTVMNGSTPVPNADVSLVLNPGTGLSAETGKKTDSNGKATIKITVTQDFSADTTVSVKAVATISGKTYESATNTLTVKYVPYNITVALEKNQADGKKDIAVNATVTVKNGTTPITGVNVILTALPGTNIQITPANATTDANGSAKFTITLTSDFTSDTTITIVPKVTIDTVEYPGASATLTIKAVTQPAYEVDLNLDPREIEGSTDATVKATITVMLGGVGVANITVKLVFDNPDGLTTEPATATTGANGVATLTIKLTKDFSSETKIKVTPNVEGKEYSNATQTLTIKAKAGNTTPGFEFVAVMAAIALVAGISVYTRRKER